MNRTCWTRHLARLLLLALVLAVASPRVWGWSQPGHVITAMLAEKHVNQKTKQGIQDLIGNKRISSLDIAVWADRIISNKELKKKFPNNDKWHYVDIPFGEKDFNPMRDCDGDNCVISKIEHFKGVLANAAADKEDRVAALKFLVHFVGDLHQPLHCIERNNDRGGNAVKVDINGVPDRDLNLHRLWDRRLVEEAMDGLTEADYVHRIDGKITSDMKKNWGVGDAKAWAWDAHVLAMEKGYKDSQGKVFSADKNTPAQIDDAYLNDRKVIVEGQLQRGGIRLAMILNDAFK